MCGIAGIALCEGPADRALLERMTERLRHRGPDDGGVVVRGSVGLGHRRLSVLDLSPAGHQPMATRDETVWITYNGEVYNFLDLRDELAGVGEHFRSRSDTEVILAAYRRWGRECWRHFNGMFALGIWDETTRELVLVRDRFGIKPLFYAHLADRLVFGSELKAIVTDPAVPREIDPEALDLYLTLGYIPAPWTIYRHVRALLPGHEAIWRAGRFSARRWYDLAANKAERPPDFETARSELRARLGRAVRRRMIADVPLGAFLSGGIDSSSVVALMAQHSATPVRTFTIGFSDGMFDERRYAGILARHYGTEHHEFRLNEQDIIDVIPPVLDHFDQPFADSSALPTYLVSAHARKHVTVALAGDTADEAFAGYRKYLGEYYFAAYRRLPGWLRDGLIPALVKRLPEAQGRRLGERVRQARRFLAARDDDAIGRHFEWMDISPGRVRMILTGRDDGGARARELVRQWDERSGETGLNAALYGDIHLCLPDDMFVKVDTMSMYHALEVREPFSDPEVIELAAALPASWKLNGRRRKHVLLEAMRDLLPEEIRRRGKQGFVVPLSNWFHTALRSIFWDVVTERAACEVGWVRMDGVRRLYAEHLTRKADHTHRLWAIFAFHWWYGRVHGG